MVVSVMVMVRLLAYIKKATPLTLLIALQCVRKTEGVVATIKG